MVAFNHDTGRVNKCTFCNDRIHNSIGPACAKTCPTQSIQFGERETLVAEAKKRVAEFKEQGYKEAQLYGADRTGLLGGLNAFFLLLDKPSTYDLPGEPETAPAQRHGRFGLSVGSALAGRRGALMAFRERGGNGDAGGRRRCLRAPEWEMMIVWYFFLGGIAGGAYFTAAIADNFGGARDRRSPSRLLPGPPPDRWSAGSC